MIRRPPRSTLFPYTRSSDLIPFGGFGQAVVVEAVRRPAQPGERTGAEFWADRKSTRLNSSHQIISYAVFCLNKKHSTEFSAESNLHDRVLPHARGTLHVSI